MAMQLRNVLLYVIQTKDGLEGQIRAPVHLMFNKQITVFRACQRVYCNRSRMTSQRVKNKKYEIEWRDCCSLHAVTSSVARNKCLHKNSNGLLKNLGA